MRTCSLQSGEVADAGSEVVTQELAQFTDAENHAPTEVPGFEGELAATDKVDTGELQQFLSRPIRISNLSWTEAETMGIKTTIDPWTLYLNTTIIKKKLDNYAWLRANLRLKIVVTASPFYYGLMMASYKPLQDYIGADSGWSASSNGPILRSQRPHVMILPADSLGGELNLPFVYPANFVNVQTAADVATLGRLTFDIISVLQSANGVTGQAVSIQTFAWLENVTLQGPSVGLALQSKQVVSGGFVSTIASAAAKFANKATAWPFVGKFMKATEVGATALGEIASMFGFTNVPVLEAARPFRNVPFPPLASTEIGYPVEKLTADPHNELAIDGAPLNLTLDDELQIAHLVQRASYLTKAVWSTSTLVDAQLFRSLVTPQLLGYDSTTNQNAVFYTPMAWVSQVFSHWRGDIVFRFDFIKSKYHRGRVLIAWDPSAQLTNNISQTANIMGQVITKIVDIGAESSVELTVPYAQAYPWLRNVLNPTYTTYTVNGADAAVSTYNPVYHNGLIVMRVLNVLTAPVASSTIDVVVTVRGAENLEFNNPISPPQFSQWATQAHEVFETETTHEIMGTESTPDANRFLVNMGESFKSVRELMRRSVLNEVWEQPSDTTNQLQYLSHTQTRFPPTYGYDPGGVWTAKGLNVPASNFAFNYTNNTFFNWFSPAFVGVRGSMMWHFNVFNQSAGVQTPTPVRVSRLTGTVGALRNTFSQAVKTGANDAYFWYSSGASSGNGLALTNTQTQTGLSVLIPNYTHTLFTSTEAGQYTQPTGNSVTNAKDIDGAELNVLLHPAQGQTTRALTIEKYCGIGTDLSLNYFINVPVWYQYKSLPAP